MEHERLPADHINAGPRVMDVTIENQIWRCCSNMGHSSKGDVEVGV